jgi:hypothetical protein
MRQEEQPENVLRRVTEDPVRRETVREDREIVRQDRETAPQDRETVREDRETVRAADLKVRIRIRSLNAEEAAQAAADVRNVRTREEAQMYLPRSSASRTEETGMRRTPVIRIVTITRGTERERILLPRISFAVRRARRYRPSRPDRRLRRLRKSR